MAAFARTAGFYALVLFIVVFSVFPFYYAIVTSFKSGTDLFRVDYFPRSFSLANYEGVFNNGVFLQNVLNSVIVATAVVIISLFLAVTAAYALSRIRFKGRGLLLLTILAVSMFPQIAVLAGLFQMVRWMGIYNSLFSLIFAYMIFSLSPSGCSPPSCGTCRRRSRRRPSWTAPGHSPSSRGCFCR